MNYRKPECVVYRATEMLIASSKRLRYRRVVTGHILPNILTDDIFFVSSRRITHLYHLIASLAFTRLKARKQAENFRLTFFIAGFTP
jgi:hypothetical protein